MKPRDIYDPLGTKTAEFISRMRQQFPKYSKAANSMANHPEQTGVCLTNAAQRVFNAPRAPKRRRPCKYTFRLTEADAARFDAARAAHGHSAQQAAEAAVFLYIEKAAPGEATPETANKIKPPKE